LLGKKDADLGCVARNSLGSRSWFTDVRAFLAAPDVAVCWAEPVFPSSPDDVLNPSPLLKVIKKHPES